MTWLGERWAIRYLEQHGFTVHRGDCPFPVPTPDTPAPPPAVTRSGPRLFQLLQGDNGT